MPLIALVSAEWAGSEKKIAGYPIWTAADNRRLDFPRDPEMKSMVHDATLLAAEAYNSGLF